MKKIFTILIIALFFLASCKKENQNEQGEVLFCTNSNIINCPFAIEISIDNTVIDTLTAASVYSPINCNCPDTASIGLLLKIQYGSHSYLAEELNCQAINRTNIWSGNFTINDNSCKTILLDVIE